MAGKNSKKDTKSHHAKEKGVPLSIIIDDDAAPDRIYSNHIRVAHTPFDFTLDFCDLGPFAESKLQEYKDRAEVHVTPRVRIALTKDVAEALQKALQKNLEIYQSHIGEL